MGLFMMVIGKMENEMGLEHTACHKKGVDTKNNTQVAGKMIKDT